MAPADPKKTDPSVFDGVTTGIVLGSGLFGVGETYPARVVIPFEDVEGLDSPGVPGHAGEFRLCDVAGRPCLFVCGRKHYYEGGADAIESLLRFVRDCGVRRLLLTSAAGSVIKSIRPGELVLVDDILDFQFRVPVRAGIGNAVSAAARPGTHRPLTPDARLGEEVRNAASSARVRLARGNAVTCAGPMYESPVEIRMIQQMGAALVTMSGAPEIALASELGIRAVMIGLVTNWASGISGVRLHHKDVLGKAEAAVSELRQLVEKFVAQGPPSGVRPGSG